MPDVYEFLDDVFRKARLDPQNAKITYEEARNHILSDHRDVADRATALLDAVTSLSKQQLSDAGWQELMQVRDSSARDILSDDNTRQRRAISSIVAIWGLEVVNHYGWTLASRTKAEKLRLCALRYPDFESQFVLVANFVQIRRHERSMMDNHVLSLGDHHASSKQAEDGLRHSPLTVNDIRLIIRIGENECPFAYGVAMNPQEVFSAHERAFQERWCRADCNPEVSGKFLSSLRPTQTHRFFLDRDRFGTLVPRECTRALTGQGSKRRRTSSRRKSRPWGEQAFTVPRVRRAIPLATKNLEAEMPATASRIDSACQDEAAHRNAKSANEGHPQASGHGQIEADRVTNPADLSASRPTENTNHECPPVPESSLESLILQNHRGLIDGHTNCIATDLSDKNQTEFEVRKSWLCSHTQLAKIYIDPGSTLGYGKSAIESDADVIYMTGQEFSDLSRQGKVFTKPIVLKEQFGDAGIFTLDEFSSLLHDMYWGDTLQIRALGQSTTQTMDISAFAQILLEKVSYEPTHQHYGLNALDFHGITRCARPRFTHLRRYRLLESLCEADIQGGPGKRNFRGGKSTPSDISGSLSFNILGLKGAFSGPHMDALAGTWVRNLCGVKFWMIVRDSEMEEDDWAAFLQSGSHWKPNGKERLIVLETDDVLIMPPGIRIIHAVHTPESSLMEGGMFWDDQNLLNILSMLHNIGRHQASTNEPIPFQLPRIIDRLEKLVSTDFNRFKAQDTSFEALFADRVRDMRDLGCYCEKRKCSPSECSCLQESRRCTGFCSKHAALPPNSGKTCMSEDSIV